MKVVTILGARPQFIKAASVSREFEKYDEIKEIIVHTGQHFDVNMSDVFFKEMHIPRPSYNLGVNGKNHGAMTGEMLEKIESILLEEKPDWVIVYGDTNSTLAGALAASKLNIKIAHIEAGLRSYNMNMPEEINRILTDRISNLLFCPTDSAIENLKKEGFENYNCEMIKNGDVMQDGAVFYSKLAQKPSVISDNQDFILSTFHRAENTDNDERLKAIVKALNTISEEKIIILPLHPRTRKLLNEKPYSLSKNIQVIDPVGYLEMIWLIKNCSLVLTDSGGLQKEAFFFRKYCITLRDETEWIELIENNLNVLAGAASKKIIDIYQNHVFQNNFNLNLYGDGEASKIIVNTLLKEKLNV